MLYLTVAEIQVSLANLELKGIGSLPLSTSIIGKEVAPHNEVTLYGILTEKIADSRNGVVYLVWINQPVVARHYIDHIRCFHQFARTQIKTSGFAGLHFVSAPCSLHLGQIAKPTHCGVFLCFSVKGAHFSEVGRALGTDANRFLFFRSDGQ